MITINNPTIVKKNNKDYLKARINIDPINFNDDIWFCVDNIYGQYLCENVADAFLVATLLPAVVYEQDVVVKASVSEKLYYNICNSLIYTLSHVWKKKRIKVYVENLVVNHYNGDGVGCGCSLGVDSFAAMIQHLSDECPPSYRITHLTYFNVGAMGYKDLLKAQKSFDKDFELVKEYASVHNLPVLCLESNISLLYKDFDFDQSGLFRNMSAVLSIQKLFSKYLYASSVSIGDFQLLASDPGYMEPMLLPLLSTESTELVEANPDMSRVDKTKMIIDNPDVKKYLYVCWKELLANKHPNSEIARIKDKKLNCSRCEKCLRTLAAIDLLGKLNEYREIFDVDYYLTVRDDFFAHVIYQRKKNVLYADIYKLMKEVNYRPSFKARVFLLLYYSRIIGIILRIKKESL